MQCTVYTTVRVISSEKKLSLSKLHLKIAREGKQENENGNGQIVPFGINNAIRKRSGTRNNGSGNLFNYLVVVNVVVICHR